MKHRNPIAVFFLSLFTLGIYAFVWHVKTKNELNRLGAHIPTAWLLIIPFANLYWVWKYCEGVEQVSNDKISAVMALILMLLLSIVGISILQSMYNGLATPQTTPAPATAGVPPQAIAGQMAAPAPMAAPAAPMTPPVAPSPSPIPQDINSPQPPPQPPANPPTV